MPYDIRALRNRKVVAEVRILKVEQTSDQNPSLFDVPTDAEFWSQCDDMQDASKLNLIPPMYPESSKANREQGRVILYAVVELDGSLSRLTVIQGATPGLEAAATTAVRQWRYKPAVCGQTPIRVDTDISVEFWFQ